ncbi:BglG family transcription antiterminator [Paenibacillus larvae]|uniref:BglG family transcription antiterminator n=1 Tax=Paenibacillus larvae TaxID=1464 RepID=UPI00227F7B66|nr:BglG family transcription antiterminator [Paenibacillus larvae]MCY9512118.1 BglG family transcription antiterminator [Paenibacillus larvae]MCY9525734.1 BglG family transcription antiterminator [Paenibacillus larvae]
MKGLDIPSRQRGILFMLLHREESITVEQIAKELDISPRTVHRELKAIETILDSYRLKLRKKTRVGLELEGSKEHKDKLTQALLFTPVQEYTVPERKVYLLSMLLESSEPIKLFTLSNELKVTAATVSNDLNQLADWFKQYKLRLIRRRGYGILLTGSEEAKRKAILSLIIGHFTDAELFMLIQGYPALRDRQARISPVSNKLLDLIARDKLEMIDSALGEIDKELMAPFADTSYLYFMVYLALMLKRLELGLELSLDSTSKEAAKRAPEYNVAEKIFRHIAETFGVELPEDEACGFTPYIKSGKLRKPSEEWIDAENIELSTLVYELVSYCEQKLHADLLSDRNLMQGLVSHLEPSIYRIRENIIVQNPYLDQIRSDYAHVYQIVEEAVHQVMPQVKVPDDEIGFLVMHIAASLDNKHLLHKTFKGLVFCASGIGTSKMLATRIRNKIPELQVLKNVSIFELDQIDPGAYDLIISTVKLPIDASQYVLVSPLLTDGEVEMIRRLLEQKEAVRKVKKEKVREGLSDKEMRATVKSLQVMEQGKAYLEESLHLSRQFRLEYLRVNGRSLEEVLLEICTGLSKEGVLGDAEAVTARLLEREKQGGLGIPGSKLAFFHCRHESVYTTSFTMYDLSEEKNLIAMDQQRIGISRLMLLLSPVKVKEEKLEVLSFVSSLFVEREPVDIFSSGNQARLNAYLSGQLLEFCQKKL